MQNDARQIGLAFGGCHCSLPGKEFHLPSSTQTPGGTNTDTVLGSNALAVLNIPEPLTAPTRFAGLPCLDTWNRGDS